MATDASDSTRPFSGKTAWARSLETPLREFIGTETGSAGVLLLAVFWSGLSFAFGVAAVAFGSGRNEGTAKAGVYLGAAAVVLAAVGCVVLS